MQNFRDKPKYETLLLNRKILRNFMEPKSEEIVIVPSWILKHPKLKERNCFYLDQVNND
jgi:hypothetical protein